MAFSVRPGKKGMPFIFTAPPTKSSPSIWTPAGFIDPLIFCNLIITGHQPFDQRRAKPPMLHLIQPRDRTSLGSSYLVDLLLRMRPPLQQELRSPLHGLGRYQAGRGRIKPDLDPPLDIRPDI